MLLVQYTSDERSGSSEKTSQSRSDDIISEATTQAFQQTTDTEENESRAMTAMTGDDDAQSAVTGYTTEVESGNR